jgi:predicted HNH restriction endonuclease
LAEWWRTQPARSPKYLTHKVATALVSEILKINPELSNHLDGSSHFSGTSVPNRKKASRYSEGNKKEVILEISERDPALKRAAVAEHGDSCMICGFNFKQAYGDLGHGFIEMHHLKLLSKAGAKEHTVKDVIVSCANCHRMLHRKRGEPMRWRALRNLVKLQAEKRDATANSP